MSLVARGLGIGYAAVLVTAGLGLTTPPGPGALGGARGGYDAPYERLSPLPRLKLPTLAELRSGAPELAPRAVYEAELEATRRAAEIIDRAGAAARTGERLAAEDARALTALLAAAPLARQALTADEVAAIDQRTLDMLRQIQNRRRAIILVILLLIQ
jgi:hypothetical protein